MALKIRFWQQGKKNQRSYRLVVANVLTSRDGKYIECLGWYNPRGDEKKGLLYAIHEDRVNYWLDNGAEPTEKALSLLKGKSPNTIKQWNEKKQKKRENSHKKKVSSTNDADADASA